MRFESATELLRYVDTYLDSLVGKPPQSVEEARERIRTLLALRDEMERFHFPNPRFAVMELIRILQERLPNMEKEDLAEVLPQIRLLKYAYDVRKWAYERARAAYIANRAAMRAMELGILADFLPHLPYGGEYRLMLEGIGGTAFLVLRKILEEMGVREERVEVEMGERVSVRHVPPRRGVFGDRLATVVLVSMAVRKAWEEGKRDIMKALERIPNAERVREYERIVRRYDPATVQRNPRRLWDLLQELEEKGFIVNGEIDPEILEGLRMKRLIKYRELRKRAEEELSRFFGEYYLMTPARERRNRPIMPGIPAEHGDVPFLAWKEAIELKEKVERDMGIPAKYAGAAALVVLEGMDAKEVARRYGLDEERLKRYVEAVREYRRGGSRLRRFFEALGGRDEEA